MYGTLQTPSETGSVQVRFAWFGASICRDVPAQCRRARVVQRIASRSVRPNQIRLFELNERSKSVAVLRGQ
jgi:hypothetical protein